MSSKILQIFCLKLQISNPTILKTVTNTKNCQLGKFLRILSSLQKYLFETSTTHTEKTRKCKFQKFQLNFEFLRKLSNLELKFLDCFFHSETPYNFPNLLNCFVREIFSNQKKYTIFCVYEH